MSSSDEKSLYFILDGLKKDINQIDRAVGKVGNVTSSIQTEVKMIRGTVEKQDGDIRTLYKNQDFIKVNLEKHSTEINRLLDDTKSIKVSKQSKTSLNPLSNNGWKASLVRMLPWLVVSLLIGMGIVGWLIGVYFGS